MTKEEIFEDLKDLVKTITSGNLENEQVFKLWRGKSKRVEKSVDGLDSCDMLWLSAEYKKWYKEEILPTLPEYMKEDFGKEFPWM